MTFQLKPNNTYLAMFAKDGEKYSLKFSNIKQMTDKLYAYNVINIDTNEFGIFETEHSFHLKGTFTSDTTSSFIIIDPRPIQKGDNLDDFCKYCVNNIQDDDEEEYDPYPWDDTCDCELCDGQSIVHSEYDIPVSMRRERRPPYCSDESYYYWRNNYNNPSDNEDEDNE